MSSARYERMLAEFEADVLRTHRQALSIVAAGDVLEIGGGTGANLPLYTGRVRTLTIAEREKRTLTITEPEKLS